MEPTGVPANMDTRIPIAVQHTENITEQMTTALKLLNTRMADKAGNIIRAVVKSEPTKFIAKTMTSAVIMAMSILYCPALIPVATEKFSSNVTAKILL